MSVIDDYLKNIPADQKAELERIRTIVKDMVPDAEETIGYGMPVFKVKGKYLIGMCNFKDHLSIFPGSEAIEVLAEQIKGYKTAKGTVQFTLENPLPEEVIRHIVQFRLDDLQK